MHTERLEQKLFQKAVVFLLLLMPVLLSSEPVWSGNASVDGEEFVNFIEDTPLAGASSSFTRNTVIEVTNTQNGRTEEVTIVKRAPRPGVFLVLSTAAGDALGLPSDQVVPVQVRVKSDTAVSTYENRFESPDPDINPAVSLPEEVSEAGTALVPPDAAVPLEVIPETGGTDLTDGTISPEVEETVSEPDFLDGPVPVPLPDAPIVMEEDVIPEEPESSSTVSPEVPPVEEVLGEESFPIEGDALVLSEESAEEEALPEEMEPAEGLLPGDMAGENVIYFLTPSDFRPPEAPEVEDEIVPVYVDREELENRIEEQLENGSSYIQLGAYSSSELVYGEMDRIAVKYPMIVWTDESGSGPVYKLLIGPLTGDETGVLVYRFRAEGYRDLFLYRP